MKIFLVLGDSGSYEDHKDWIVAGYVDRKDAEKHAAAANKAAKAYYESIKDRPYTYSDEELRKFTGTLDPKAKSLGRDDTTYTVITTELNDSFCL